MVVSGQAREIRICNRDKAAATPAAPGEGIQWKRTTTGQRSQDTARNRVRGGVYVLGFDVNVGWPYIGIDGRTN